MDASTFNMKDLAQFGALGVLMLVLRWFMFAVEKKLDRFSDSNEKNTAAVMAHTSEIRELRQELAGIERDVRDVRDITGKHIVPTALSGGQK